MRNDIIPKHIKLDTTTLVHLLMTKKQGKNSDYLFKGTRNMLWGLRATKTYEIQIINKRKRL